MSSKTNTNSTSLANARAGERHYFLEKFLERLDNILFFAGVAQLVEHHLAKVDVEGSNPFARSNKPHKLSLLSVKFFLN